MGQWCASNATLRNLVDLLECDEQIFRHSIPKVVPPLPRYFLWAVNRAKAHESLLGGKKSKQTANSRWQNIWVAIKLTQQQLCLQRWDIYGSQTLAPQLSSITSCWLTAQLFTQQHTTLFTTVNVPSLQLDKPYFICIFRSLLFIPDSNKVELHHEESSQETE